MKRAMCAFILLTFAILLPARLLAHPAGKAPELIGQSSDWINTGGKALHLYGPGGLLERGADGKAHHVVLIDFWEYTCVNCIRTLPYLKAWDAEYRGDGLIIVGIHSPEFAFAHDASNVRAAVLRLGIRYPVVNDDAYRNWNAWKNDSWPREILIDSNGTILEDREGEGDYARTEAKIRVALRHIKSGSFNQPLAAAPIGIDLSRTPEMYCGYERGLANYINVGGIKRDKPNVYRDPALTAYRDGCIALIGTWNVTAESLRHVGRNRNDYLAIRYHGPDCNAVIKPERGTACDVIVCQDNLLIRKADAGDDIRYDAQGRSYIHINQPRMYSITRLAQPGAHRLTLEPTSDGFGLYSFAF